MAEQQVQIPQREVLTQIQIQNLLGAVNTLTMSLTHTGIQEENNRPSYSEANIAIETSLIKVCERLDKLMAENDRWELSSVRVLEEKLAALYDANTRLLEMRKQVESQALSPHVRYKPVVMRLAGGWAAIYGNPDFLDKAIVGYGETPEKALKCFDMIFDGSLTDDMVQWIKKQNENFTNFTTVDTTTNSPLENNAGGQASGNLYGESSPSDS